MSILTIGNISLLSAHAKESFPNAAIESVSPRMNCPNCNWYTSLYCLQNLRYSYSFPHTSTCQVKVYVSNAVDGCIQCGKWQQYYSEHECLYVHSTCSKGSESKCLIGVWWPN